jgi:hypothetical protein
MYPNKDRCPRFLNWKLRRKRWVKTKKMMLLPRGIPNPEFKKVPGAGAAAKPKKEADPENLDDEVNVGVEVVSQIEDQLG